MFRRALSEGVLYFSTGVKRLVRLYSLDVFLPYVIIFSTLARLHCVVFSVLQRSTGYRMCDVYGSVTRGSSDGVDQPEKLCKTKVNL